MIDCTFMDPSMLLMKAFGLLEPLKSFSFLELLRNASAIDGVDIGAPRSKAKATLISEMVAQLMKLLLSTLATLKSWTRSCKNFRVNFDSTLEFNQSNQSCDHF